MGLKLPNSGGLFNFLLRIKTNNQVQQYRISDSWLSAGLSVFAETYILCPGDNIEVIIFTP